MTQIQKNSPQENFSKIFISQSEEDTRRYGEELAKELKPGDVLALSGDLGAGKTALTKAIAKGLGIDDMIQSPTFTIVREYHSGRLPLYHFDLYRLGDEDELFEIGFEEYLYGQGVCVAEWANLFDDLFPEHTIRIHIEYGETETQRIYKRI